MADMLGERRGLDSEVESEGYKPGLNDTQVSFPHFHTAPSPC
jgi:hypothetical protein